MVDHHRWDGKANHSHPRPGFPWHLFLPINAVSLISSVSGKQSFNDSVNVKYNYTFINIACCYKNTHKKRKFIANLKYKCQRHVYVHSFPK